MKRKLAWLLSAAMMFSSVPAGSINVLAASTQQEASSQAEEELTVQEEAETASEQTIQTEDFEETADIVEGADIEEPIPGDAEELSEDAQEITADSDFSDGEEAAAEESSTEESEEIHLGENILDIASGMNYTWKFTAQEESTYKFHASSGMSFYMNFNDGHNYEDIDSDENGQFIEWYLEENQTCYIEIEVGDENDDSEQLKLVVKKICDTHVPLAGSEVVTQPTCEEEGYTTYTCQVCGEKYKDNYVDPTGHQFEQTGKQEPTCEETGYTTYTCKICGYDYTDDYIDSLGHQYTITDRQDATCTESGYVQYTCKICGNEYEEYLSAYHQLDESGVCTVCQTESPYKIMNAELTEDDADTVGFEYEYDGEEDCQAYIEIYDEESDELVFKEYTDIAPSENKGEIYVGIDWPKYYIIKAYLSENGHVISNTYVNLFHTKAFDNLDNYVPDYKDDHTVDLSAGNYGVFAEDTVVIHGNASENTLVETSLDSTVYTLTNANSQAKNITSGCNLAYFYEDELKLVVCVSEVTWVDNKTVSFKAGQPVLEEVFEYLRIDSAAEDQACTVDLSGLPAGVSYGGVAAGFSTQAQDYDIEGYAGVQEMQTTFSNTQNYSFDSVKINDSAKLDGSVQLDMKFPFKIYISESQKMMQFGVDSSLKGNLTLSGKGGIQIPLGTYMVPLMNGVLYLKMMPACVVEAAGKMSITSTTTGSVMMQADSTNGLQIISRKFNAGDLETNIEGTLSCGLQIKPELYLTPKKQLATVSLAMGPKFSAALRTPIPEAQQKPGDHTCQACISGHGEMDINIGANVTAFAEEFGASHTFVLNQFDYYYSFDHVTGGKKKCPYIKGGEEPDEPEEPDDSDDDSDDDWDDEKGKDVCFEENYGTYKVHYCARLYNDGTCALTDLRAENSSGDYVSLNEVTIPSYLYYKNHAFAVRYIYCEYNGYEQSVQHLIIPETVERISSIGGGFDVKRVTFAGTVKILDEHAFSGCRNLESIELPDGLEKIENYAFMDCSSLETLVIPDSVTNIGNMAFEACSSLTDIILPDSLETIGDNAFWYCSSLERVILPEHVRKIGVYAFYGCESLNTIYLPDSVTEIGGASFKNCGNQITITIGSGMNISELRSEIDEESIRKVYLTESRTKIDDSAFWYWINLETIYIPDSIEVIGDNAFSHCSSLTEIYLPEGLKKIGSNAFDNCTKLETCILPDSLEECGDYSVFKNCSSLKEIRLPSGITTIEALMFEGCSSLTDITIPSNITHIEGFAFWKCSGLKSIIIPDSVEYVGCGAFSDCYNLTEMTLGKNVKMSGDVTTFFYYWGCSDTLTKVHLTDGRKEIEKNTFFCCGNLKTITIPSSVEKIDDSFFGCYNLKQIVITGKNTIVSRWSEFPYGSEYPDLKIYGLTGSVAEKTVPRNLNFVALEKIDEEGHGYITDHVITPSTCSTPGEYVLKCVLCENCGKTCTAEMPLSDKHEKIEKTSLVQASIGSSGKTAGSYCKACGKTVEEGETIPAIKTITLSKTSYSYNGKVQKPTITVKDSAGNKLSSGSYSVTYDSGCTNAGTYNVKVNFKGNYKGSKSLSYKITPAAQKMTVKTSARTYTYTTAKAQTFSIGASAKTPVSYKSSNTKYVTVDKKGKVTVKKGSPWGTYTVTATAAKNKNYSGAAKTITIKINPLTQSVKAKVSSKTYKYAAVKKGKQTFSIGASAKTTLSYSSSNTKYVTVNKKGAVTVKKGTPKGTYKITAKAAKSAGYAEAKKVITIKIL